MSQNSLNRLIALMKDVLNGEVEVLSFCHEFETIYNFHFNVNQLPEPAKSSFKALFEVVVWYSPFVEERKTMPHYKNEDDVLDATRKALEDAGL